MPISVISLPSLQRPRFDPRAVDVESVAGTRLYSKYLSSALSVVILSVPPILILVIHVYHET